MEQNSHLVAEDICYPVVDLAAVAGVQEEMPLEVALECLRGLYATVDEIITATTAELDLPCRYGCNQCCCESVFLTPLEFYGIWDEVQRCCSEQQRSHMVTRGLALYQQHQSIIEQFQHPPPVGHKDHFFLARQLHYECIMLGDEGQCLIYPMRELLSRLFGCSFAPAGRLYACDLVSAHLENRQVTLLPVQQTLHHLQRLPLTHYRQVYPYYIHQLYGGLAL